MNSILLQNLADIDIQWLLENGEKYNLEPQSLLENSDQRGKFLYLLLEGNIGLCLMPQRPERESEPAELRQMSSGEILGFVPFVNQFLPQGVMQAFVASRLLKVPHNVLEKKLLDDMEFSARFYRAIAQYLAHRLSYFSHRCGYSLTLLKQLHLKEASTLFAALQDGDLDWLIAVGQVRDYEAGAPVTASRRPLHELHIILEGALSLTAPEQEPPLIEAAFSNSNDRPREVEYARLSRGELLGEAFLVESMPPVYGARALRSSRLLSIPRWRLETKLIYDPLFAAQLYRVLAIVLANKQHSLLGQIGFRIPMTELDDQLLQKVNLAEARFEWLLKRIRTQSVNLSSLPAA